MLGVHGHLRGSAAVQVIGMDELDQAPAEQLAAAVTERAFEGEVHALEATVRSLHAQHVFAQVEEWIVLSPCTFLDARELARDHDEADHTTVAHERIHARAPVAALAVGRVVLAMELRRLRGERDPFVMVERHFPLSRRHIAQDLLADHLVDREIGHRAVDEANASGAIEQHDHIGRLLGDRSHERIERLFRCRAKRSRTFGRALRFRSTSSACSRLGRLHLA